MPAATLAADGPSLGDATPTSSSLRLLNDATKFFVSLIALAVLLWLHNAPAALALFGSVVTSGAGKVLKRVLAHSRPDGAPKADHGMPSSHAVSLAYLSTYAAAALLKHVPSPWMPVLAGVVVAAGLFLTSLRVVLGFHTLPQVIVGWVFGASCAGSFFATANAFLLPLIEQQQALRFALYTATTAAVAAFCVQGAASWTADARDLIRTQQRDARANT